MFKVFKEFISHEGAYNGDINALILNVVGGILIAITFFVVGIVYIFLSKKEIGNVTSKRRKRLATLFGLFLISCSFSRAISVLCIWHNYAILDGWVKVITGLLAFFAIIYIPKTIKEVLSSKKLEEAHDMLQKTQQDLNEVKQLTEKLTDKK